MARGVHFGPQRDLKEDGGSVKQKGGLGICEACSRWQVRGGGGSALAVGDCAQGWRRGRCCTESSAPCSCIYLFIGGVVSSLAHPGLQSSWQLWVLKFWCSSVLEGGFFVWLVLVLVSSAQ